MMFSHFLNSTRIFFLRSRTPANPRSGREAEQQLQDELARAISENIFSMRSQEHALPSNDGQGLSINGLPPASKRKRKAERSLDTTPVEENTKRRRKDSVAKATSSSEDGVDGNALTSPRQPIEPSFNIEESKNSEISGRVSLGSDETSPRALYPSVPTPSAPVGFVHNDTVTPKALDRQLKKGKVAKKRMKAQSPDPSEDAPTTQPLPNPPRATHKRFGNEDFNPPKTVSSSTGIEDSPIAVPPEDNVEAENEADSSDEAPETVTASAGLKQAKAAVSEAAKVAKRYRPIFSRDFHEHFLTLPRQAEAEKQKRKERDARLKDQAKLSKKHRKLPIDEPSDDQSSSSSEPTQNTTAHNRPPSKHPLPTLLPLTLLSAPAPAPPSHSPPPPTPQPPHQSTLARKLKRQDAALKPVKDIMRGPVRVRVLEKENAMLPPKVERRSMEVRERWLKGRGVERQAMRGGFVRGA